MPEPATRAHLHDAAVTPGFIPNPQEITAMSAKPLRTTFVAAAIALLAACGGGADDTTDDNPPVVVDDAGAGGNPPPSLWL
jgi:hypothetical protein